MERKYLYSTGEFADLNDINRRTLHYYDEIGLFRPAMKDEENGYRYYTCFQTVQLAFITTLRKMGLGIGEIKKFLDSPSAESMNSLIGEKMELIDRTIEDLQNIRAFLEKKQIRYELSENAEHGRIETVNLPDQRIVLSNPILFEDDNDDFEFEAEFALRLKKLFGLYDNFGYCFSTEKEHPEFYRYFIRCRENMVEHDAMKPGGLYMRSYSVGGWEKTVEVIKDFMLPYAKEHCLRFCGDIYCEGLNELSLPDKADYITYITVRCEKKE